MTIWVLILVCYQSFFCSAGADWQTDKVYSTREECLAAGEIRAKKNNIAVCLEGALFK